MRHRRLLHDLAQLAELGETTGDPPQPLACALAQGMPDKQVPMREQIGALLFPALVLAGGLRGRLRARTTPGSLGLLGRQALALAGHRFQHRFDDILDNMKLAQLMRYPIKNLGEGRGRERRALGGDAPQRQVTRCQGRFQPTQKGPDVLVVGVVVSDVIEDALVAAIIDCGEHTEGTIREFVGSHIPRKIR